MQKRDARSRVDRIFAFQEELQHLQEEGIARFSEADAAAVGEYHKSILTDYSEQFDTSQVKSENPLSWGARLSSVFGAVALSLSVFMFFQYYWDIFSTTLQVSLVTIAPFLGWALTEFVAKRFKESLYTSLAIFVALASFVANLAIVGTIYNVTPSPGAFLAWGLFGLFLGLRHGLTFVVGLSLISMVAFIGGALTELFGFLWPHSMLLELYLLGSVILLVIPAVIRHSAIEQHKFTFYFIGLLGSFLALEALMIWSDRSLMPFERTSIEFTYTLLAFAATSLVLWRTLKANWTVGIYLSIIFLILHSLFKYADWFFDEWPYYVFFMVLGVLSIGMIFVLNKLRLKQREKSQ